MPANPSKQKDGEGRYGEYEYEYMGHVIGQSIARLAYSALAG